MVSLTLVQGRPPLGSVSVHSGRVTRAWECDPGRPSEEGTAGAQRRRGRTARRAEGVGGPPKGREEGNPWPERVWAARPSVGRDAGLKPWTRRRLRFRLDDDDDRVRGPGPVAASRAPEGDDRADGTRRGSAEAGWRAVLRLVQGQSRPRVWVDSRSGTGDGRQFLRRSQYGRPLSCCSSLELSFPWRLRSSLTGPEGDGGLLGRARMATTAACSVLGFLRALESQETLGWSGEQRARSLSGPPVAARWGAKGGRIEPGVGQGTSGSSHGRVDGQLAARRKGTGAKGSGPRGSPGMLKRSRGFPARS